MPDFAELWPERFNNKTNGITQRRWLLKANPAAGRFDPFNHRRRAGSPISASFGRWRNGRRIATFQAEFQRVKRSNKEQLAKLIADSLPVKVDPDSLFDIQVKRIHSYKRQLLNVMHIIDEYLA